MEFCHTVKEIRCYLNMSQEQLAKELHVSFATVNRWENGKNAPSMLAKKALYGFCIENGVDIELAKQLLE
jgi:DNA-binding transcriptional regulator YiaG